MPISIHAPHTGRDRAYKYLCDWVTQFQSTRPIRGATITRATSRLPGVNFNPRAPYGARPGNIKAHNLCFLISIHAPHTGRDPFFTGFIFTSISFQSTRPIRGATDKYTGSTWDVLNFNPRAPYGARPASVNILSCGLVDFNPRAPYGARPKGFTMSVTGSDFNPRAPYGARHSAKRRIEAGRLFQSTRPIRGATRRYGPDWWLIGISIHAPHTGRDYLLREQLHSKSGFQSTRPIRGAT